MGRRVVLELVVHCPRCIMGCTGSKQQAREPTKAADAEKTLLQQQNVENFEKDQKVDSLEAAAEHAAETQESEVVATMDQEDGSLKASMQEKVSAEKADTSEERCAATAESVVIEDESKTAVCC